MKHSLKETITIIVQLERATGAQGFHLRIKLIEQLLTTGIEQLS